MRRPNLVILPFVFLAASSVHGNWVVTSHPPSPLLLFVLQLLSSSFRLLLSFPTFFFLFLPFPFPLLFILLPIFLLPLPPSLPCPSSPPFPVPHPLLSLPLIPSFSSSHLQLHCSFRLHCSSYNVVVLPCCESAI